MGPKILSKSNIVKNFKSPGSSFYNLVKHEQNHRLPTKDPLPPIKRDNFEPDDDQSMTEYIKPNIEATEENSLPLKLFDGKKQSLNELNAASMAYIWQRRIKQIFLRMNVGRDDKDDPFVAFDMNLAKTDMANTCDRYIENERIALTKQVS